MKKKVIFCLIFLLLIIIILFSIIFFKTNIRSIVSKVIKGGENEEKTEREKLPSDLSTRPCGFYFGKYGVCGGVCPSGKCMQEGKSCYCKLV